MLRTIVKFPSFSQTYLFVEKINLILCLLTLPGKWLFLSLCFLSLGELFIEPVHSLPSPDAFFMPPLSWNSPLGARLVFLSASQVTSPALRHLGQIFWELAWELEFILIAAQAARVLFPPLGSGGLWIDSWEDSVIYLNLLSFKKKIF